MYDSSRKSGFDPKMRYDLSGLDQRTVAEAFRYLDLDDSGYIGVSELRHVLTVLAESPLDEELDMMIRMVDLDGIGKIGLGEWQRVLTTSAITSEMIAIKCASERTKKDMEALANAGVENLALAQQAQDAKKKEAREKRATATAKSEKQDLQKNYSILRQFAVAPNQLKKYYERFIQIDRDGSGSITYEEFCLVLEDEDSELLRSLFDIFDLDGSGALEMIEFIVGLSSYCTGTTNEERMKFAFMICDSDQSGQLDREMISKILSAMFLAQQCSPADVKRRTDKIFSISGSRDFITYPQLMDVSKRVPGLVFPAFSLMESAAITTRIAKNK